MEGDKDWLYIASTVRFFEFKVSVCMVDVHNHGGFSVGEGR